MSVSDGTLPVIDGRRSLRVLRPGSDLSRPIVYGCRGCFMRMRMSACSTIRPRYITTTSSAV